MADKDFAFFCKRWRVRSERKKLLSGWMVSDEGVYCTGTVYTVRSEGVRVCVYHCRSGSGAGLS